MNPRKSTDNQNEPFAGPNFHKSPNPDELPKPDFAESVEKEKFDEMDK